MVELPASAVAIEHQLQSRPRFPRAAAELPRSIVILKLRIKRDLQQHIKRGLLPTKISPFNIALQPAGLLRGESQDLFPRDQRPAPSGASFHRSIFSLKYISLYVKRSIQSSFIFFKEFNRLIKSKTYRFCWI